MKFTKIPTLVVCMYCRDAWMVNYEGETLYPDTILPCGHEVSSIHFMPADSFVDGLKAIEMIDWLSKNNYIQQEAFEELEEHGGELEPSSFTYELPKE